MTKLKISPPPFPNRERHPFTATVRYRGMVIDIENLDGSTREGVDPNGRAWRTKFKECHYGELRGSLGTDGDALDVYIKANPNDGANKAYIVHQNHPRTHPTKAGQYDEDKVIFGVSSIEDAKKLYLQHYNRKDFLRSVTEMPIEKFKRVAFKENRGEKMAAEISTAKAKEIGSQIGIDWKSEKFPVEELRAGIGVEREHGMELGEGTNVGADDIAVAARIAWAHLKELPDYYARLDKMEEEGKKALSKKANGEEEEEGEEGGAPGKSINPTTVKNWLMQNPNPNDEQVHEFAEGKGYNVHDLETVIYRLATKAVKKEAQSRFIRTKLREGGAPVETKKIKEAARGKSPQQQDILAQGREKLMAAYPGKSPGEALRAEKKLDKIKAAACMAYKKNPGYGTPKKKKKMKKTSEAAEAYKLGAQAALNDYLKEAEKTDFLTVIKKLPGSPPVKGKIPPPPKVKMPKMAQELGLNPGGGFAPMATRGAPQQVMTQAVAGPASAPGEMESMMGSRVAAPEMMTFPAATTTPSPATAPMGQPAMMASAGGVPQIPRG